MCVCVCVCVFVCVSSKDSESDSRFEKVLQRQNFFEKLIKWVVLFFALSSLIR